ncbi:MAG: hypothetical protein U1E56_09780 [Bauldia sp.]
MTLPEGPRGGGPAKRLVSLTLALLTFDAAARAAIDDPRSSFTLLCASQKSVGFSWKDGRWEMTEYRQYEYVVSKVAALSSDPLVSGQCDALVPDRNNTLVVNTEDTASAHACYQISQKQSANKILSACVESWVGADGGYALKSIQCDLPRGHLAADLADEAFEVILNPRGADIHGPLFLRSGRCNPGA